MIAVDEAALECDLCETYHIMDYRELPARRAALFACGLPPDSRIMRKLDGAPAGPELLLLARICDALHVLIWQNTRDGMEGRNPPQSIFRAMMATVNPEPEAVGFDSPEDFNEWREAITRGNDNG